MPNLIQGRIVWARVSDPQGRNTKCRCLVIVSPTSEIDPELPDQEIQAIACTTQIDQCVEKGHDVVELPWLKDGHPWTKLKKRCVADCNWPERIKLSDIEEIKGTVPDRILYKIMAILKDKARD